MMKRPTETREQDHQREYRITCRQTSLGHNAHTSTVIGLGVHEQQRHIWQSFCSSVWYHDGCLVGLLHVLGHNL